MHTPNFLARIILSIAATLLAGCSSGPAGRPEVTPIEVRVDALPGRILVIPVELHGPIDPGAPVEARLDDGRTIGAELFWISVGPDEHPDPRGWLAPAGKWYATPSAASSRPSAAGVWAVILNLPAGAAGQGLWVHGRRMPLNWIGGEEVSSAVPLPPESPGGPWLSQLLAPERDSPPRRWRWRLVHGILGAPTSGADAFSDPVLEALAAQSEDRWAAALSRLNREDPTLATELVGRLAELVDFGDAAAPAWAADGRELDGLLGDLLSPGLDAPRRASRIRAWLAARPAAVAWVVDDAGKRDAASGAPIASIGVANLLTTGVLTGLVPADGSLPNDLIPLGRSSAAILSIPVAADADHNPTPVRVRAGAWEGTATVMAAKAPVRPPGLRIGPLMRDWTMESLVSGLPAAVPDEPGSAAMLLMHENSGWMLFIEAAGGSGGEDVVRVWLGPTGAPTAVLRVSGDGFVVDEAASGSQTREPARTPVARTADGRWSCRLAIPARCIEADGVLRIGVERVDSGGHRSAWPRPMLPWQTEPGRLAVDTTTWGDLGGEKPEPGPAR